MWDLASYVFYVIYEIWFRFNKIIWNETDHWNQLDQRSKEFGWNVKGAPKAATGSGRDKQLMLINSRWSVLVADPAAHSEAQQMGATAKWQTVGKNESRDATICRLPLLATTNNYPATNIQFA